MPSKGPAFTAVRVHSAGGCSGFSDLAISTTRPNLPFGSTPPISFAKVVDGGCKVQDVQQDAQRKTKNNITSTPQWHKSP